ncbi:hypothetical protein B566_EDAN009252 [Ephemera danica]|nr:hypothetical protein B566_EDAN009252 [Ephemera danica]
MPRGTATGKYVSRKVSKVRWCSADRHSKLGIPADAFVFGSYDDEFNQLGLCQLSSEQDEFRDSTVLNTIPHAGDVTDIKFPKEDHFVASSSCGDIGFYEISNGQSPSMKEVFKWKKLHYFKNVNSAASCTAVDSLEDVLLSVGDDGRLNVVNLREFSDKPLQVIDTHFPAATCLARHPTQSHILISGDESGVVTVWDLRDTSIPTCVLNSHTTAVTEAQFHPLNTDHLFTCSAGGDLWQWDCSFPKVTNPFDTSLIPRGTVTWLALAESKHRPMLTSLMAKLPVSINTLDVSSNIVICGGDDEAIYTCTDVDVAPK